MNYLLIFRNCFQKKTAPERLCASEAVLYNCIFYLHPSDVHIAACHHNTVNSKEDQVNSYNKSLIVKCYNDSNAKRGTRESHPPKTWVDLIKILSGSQTQCTRRDLDNLVSSISDNIYKSGETAVENPLEVQSEAIRSWAMKLTEPQEDD